MEDIVKTCSLTGSGTRPTLAAVPALPAPEKSGRSHRRDEPHRGGRSQRGESSGIHAWLLRYAGAGMAARANNSSMPETRTHQTAPSLALREDEQVFVISP